MRKTTIKDDDFVMNLDLSEFESFEQLTRFVKSNFKGKDQLLDFLSKKDKARFWFKIYNDNIQYGVRFIFEYDVTDVMNEDDLEKSLDDAYELGKDEEVMELLTTFNLTFDFNFNKQRVCIYKEIINESEDSFNLPEGHQTLPNPLPF